MKTFLLIVIILLSSCKEKCTNYRGDNLPTGPKSKCYDFNGGTPIFFYPGCSWKVFNGNPHCWQLVDKSSE